METILVFIHAALLLCRVNLAETLEADATCSGMTTAVPHPNAHIYRTIPQELLLSVIACAMIRSS
jgi:hypothetical protein